MPREAPPHEDFRRITPPLDGRLVRLRAREQADLAQLNDLFNDPEVLAGLQMTFAQPLAGIREWFDRTRTAEDQVMFTIETLADRRPIGVCGLEDIDPRARSASLGIWIGRPYWDRGYGTDATRVACRFALRHMNLQRIGLHVYETNPRAIRAYEKVGFKREGVLRRAQFLGGRHVDVILMGLLAEELVEG